MEWLSFDVLPFTDCAKKQQHCQQVDAIKKAIDPDKPWEGQKKENNHNRDGLVAMKLLGLSIDDLG